MLRDTVIASALLAVVITLLGGFTGHLTFGLAVAAGLILGSGNGYLVLALFNRGTSFVAGSMFRIVTITALALLASLAFGVLVWPAILGVAAAQLVMVAASVRQGLRT
jgi:hypothetical protein